MTQELAGKFSAKSDFIKFFKEQRKCSFLTLTFLSIVQLYLPPEHMMNKDFLKEVFEGNKRLLELNEVKYVIVPLYDELSVGNLWPELQEFPEFLTFFPSKFPKGRLPDRTYMFNILNTVMTGYTQALIKHAKEQRTTASGQSMAGKSIEITDEWWDKLNSLPYISRKLSSLTNSCL